MPKKNKESVSRSERRRNKDAKNRMIVWIVIGILIVILVVMRLFEINFSNLKDSFTDSNGKFSINASSGDDNYPFNIDSSSGVIMKPSGSHMSVLTPASLTIFQPKNAKVTFTVSHGYANPITETSESYCLTYDQGTKLMRLDSMVDNIYETTTDNYIISADVSNNGIVAYSSTSNNSKSELQVVKNSLKKKMSYKTSDGYITDVAVNSSGSEVAFVSTTSSGAHLTSTLYVMRTSDKEPSFKQEINDNVIDISYCGSDVYVIGQDFVSVISNGKKYKDVYKSGTINNVTYDYLPSGELIIAYNAFKNSSDNKIARISSNGDVRMTAEVNGTIKDIAGIPSQISVLIGSKVLTYSASNGKEKGEITVPDTTSSIARMGDEVFYRYSSLVGRKGVKE